MSSDSQHAQKVPVLETSRLILRGHRFEDFAQCAVMWADPQVSRYIGGKPLTEEECWSRLLRYVGHWAWMGFGYWVAEEKETGNFVGEIGFADYKRDIESLLKGVPESCSRIAGICGAIRKLAQLVTPLKKRLPIPAGVISSPGNFVRAVTRATASMAKSATVNSDTDPFDPSPHMSTV